LEVIIQIESGHLTVIGGEKALGKNVARSVMVKSSAKGKLCERNSGEILYLFPVGKNGDTEYYTNSSLIGSLKKTQDD